MNYIQRLRNEKRIEEAERDAAALAIYRLANEKKKWGKDSVPDYRRAQQKESGDVETNNT